MTHIKLTTRVGASKNKKAKLPLVVPYADFVDEQVSLTFRESYPTLSIEDLYLHVAAQRELNKARAIKLAQIFRWSSFGTIEVMEVNGVMYIVDGQHRAAAAVLLGIQEIPCNVVKGDSEILKRSFIDMNDRRSRVSAIDKFVVRRGQLLTGGTELSRHEKREIKKAKELDNVARKAGYVISSTTIKGKSRISQVPSLKRIARRDEELNPNDPTLPHTLKTLQTNKAAWPSENFQGVIARGVSEFYYTWGSKLTVAEVVALLVDLSTVDGKSSQDGFRENLMKHDTSGEAAPFRLMLKLTEEFNNKLKKRGNRKGQLPQPHINKLKKAQLSIRFGQA